jgi:hypothetical protein
LYTPTPKKAADPRETYLVVPLKKCQLDGQTDPAEHAVSSAR